MEIISLNEKNCCTKKLINWFLNSSCDTNQTILNEIFVIEFSKCHITNDYNFSNLIAKVEESVVSIKCVNLKNFIENLSNFLHEENKLKNA